MVSGAIGMAAVSFAVGLGQLGVGTGWALPQRLQSAGRFDIAVGVSLLLYGVMILLARPSGVWFVFPVSLAYFLTGMALFRTSCVLQQSDYRNRDRTASILLWVMGAAAMLGLAGGREAFLTWLIFPALVNGLAGGLFLLGGGIQHLRGQRGLGRDVASAAAMLSAFVFLWVMFSQWFYVDATVV